MIDLALAPIWFRWQLNELGVKEVPGSESTRRIVAYRTLAHVDESDFEDDSTLPWCAIFENAAFEVNGIPGTRSDWAKSFETSDNFVRLPAPCLGCVTTFWRVAKDDPRGHVGSYRGETDKHIYVLGGNQGDEVSIAPHLKNSLTFGFSGFYWPKGLAIPKLGPIAINAGEPVQVSVT